MTTDVFLLILLFSNFCKIFKTSIEHRATMIVYSTGVDKFSIFNGAIAEVNKMFDVIQLSA